MTIPFFLIVVPIPATDNTTISQLVAAEGWLPEHVVLLTPKDAIQSTPNNCPNEKTPSGKACGQLIMSSTAPSAGSKV